MYAHPEFYIVRFGSATFGKLERIFISDKVPQAFESRFGPAASREVASRQNLTHLQIDLKGFCHVPATHVTAAARQSPLGARAAEPGVPARC